MKDVFVSVENDLDETLKQNELLKDRLLKASLAEDVKNLVITSCVEIRNKDLQDKIERISKESKEVSNERKTVDTSKVETNQCDEVKVNVNFDEIETQNIELEHQVASLLKENDHLKLVYKNLFESIKKPQVQKENLRATLSEFSVNHIFGKEYSSTSSINELEKESGKNICDNAKTAKFEAYFEKLEKTKVVLEQQLARKVDDSKAEKD
ncbi:hypothetical protein Tco_0480428 [Tanacetum coccineum]